MSNKLRVRILSTKFIPTIGKGPILNPIYITREQYNILTILGFNVEIITDTLKKINPVVNDNIVNEREIKEEIIEEVIEPFVEEIKEELVEEEVVSIEDFVEEVDSFNETEEVIVYDKAMIKDFTKKQLKEILDTKEIAYAYNSTLIDLEKLVIGTEVL